LVHDRAEPAEGVAHDVARVAEALDQPVDDVELQGAEVLNAILRGLERVERAHARHVRPRVRVPALRLEEHEAARELARVAERVRHLHVARVVVHLLPRPLREALEHFGVVEPVEVRGREEAVAARSPERVRVRLPAPARVVAPWSA
jgi:hypothetical protein